MQDDCFAPVAELLDGQLLLHQVDRPTDQLDISRLIAPARIYPVQARGEQSASWRRKHPPTSQSTTPALLRPQAENQVEGDRVWAIPVGCLISVCDRVLESLGETVRYLDSEAIPGSRSLNDGGLLKYNATATRWVTVLCAGSINDHQFHKVVLELELPAIEALVD
jgi:hypothetical protein